MKRWIFAALLLANIGLLMWATWYRGEPGTTIAARPVFHPELMVPLNTPGVALKSRRNERTEAPLVATKPKMRCVTIGPLPSVAAEAAAGWLGGEKLDAARRNEDRQVPNSYWVHIGPFENRKQAEARLKELERLGLRDMLVMPDIDGRPAISLGLFTQLENAQSRMQELSKKGIEVLQETRFHTETMAWFDLRLPEPADDIVTRLRARDWNATGSEVKDGVCPADAASTPAAPTAPAAPMPAPASAPAATPVPAPGAPAAPNNDPREH